MRFTQGRSDPRQPDAPSVSTSPARQRRSSEIHIVDALAPLEMRSGLVGRARSPEQLVGAALGGGISLLAPVFGSGHSAAVSATAQGGGTRAGASRGDGEPALEIVVIGMSAGGIYGLKTIVRALPAGFPCAVVIAHHVAGPSLLPHLICRWTEHQSRFASAGELLQAGIIYVAPADHHVVVNPDATLGIPQRERLRFVRPSIDWLFESAAVSFAERAIAVVLSGANDDGALGARSIVRAGGTLIVQDPESCEFPQMPTAVIDTGMAHRCLHPCEIGDALVRRTS
jgi:two-component system, chemotaxis family, protein-glutamate methylesterase/glutaminase